MIDWSSGKVYLPNAVHTALLQGDWLEGHVKSGTVTVLAGQEQLKSMNESEVKNKISILKSPKFWQIKTTNDDKVNSWTNSFKGRIQWGYMYNNECKFCKNNNECKHRTACKLYTIVNDEGMTL